MASSLGWDWDANLVADMIMTVAQIGVIGSRIPPENGAAASSKERVKSES